MSLETTEYESRCFPLVLPRKATNSAAFHICSLNGERSAGTADSSSGNRPGNPVQQIQSIARIRARLPEASDSFRAASHGLEEREEQDSP